MTIIKAHNLACPIDGLGFDYLEKQLVCENGHVYDIARQGYVNLLPAQHKRTRHPGDSKEMVLARSRFLNSGIYEPVARRLAQIIYSYHGDNKTSCLMDAGCGEGYYLDYVFNYFQNKNNSGEMSFIGMDISKAAIHEAAKRNKQISWLVGTNRRPAIEADSVDIILCVFGFQSFEGFNKILKSGSRIILVEPGPDHLIELREIIYSKVKRTPLQDLSRYEKLGFSVGDSQPLQFKTGLINNKQIHDLLIMTPHFYRATKEGREAAARLDTLDLTVDVMLRTLKKVKEGNE
ncbi:Ribosomal RNA large subunit methyltransferase A [hydrothermal vent metagenome]|uniref:Ribosomal RNA large subunit methyltransferase A n=1 Tax=hydrothermal vent metagenome TaxID=652676 RepID=A0A3B1BQP3_9ZZZZ